MRLQKIKAKRSKQVLGRKEERVSYVKETLFLEAYPGGPKRAIEIFYPVKDFTFGGNYYKPLNYG